MIKRNLILIVALMLVSGLIIYYLYLNPTQNINEGFSITTIPEATIAPGATTTAGATTTTIPEGCPQISSPPIPASCLSRYFGVGFNIYPANTTASSSLPANITSTNLYIIEHIPVVYNGTMGSMYAISADGQLTLKVRNDQDPTQWWVFTKKNDTTSDYYTIVPFTLIRSSDRQFALQYENGNLALRPYNANSPFESQKWTLSNTKITRGIPVLNYSPGSLFTPEFDPYSTSTSINTGSLSQQNNQQINDVLNAVKTNIQQYLQAIGASSSGVPRITTSSLGNKDTPLNINLNLGGGGSAGVSTFKNIGKSAFTDTTTSNDVLGLLDRYERTASGASNNSNTTLMNATDLMTALNSAGGCPNVNLGDYTSNRVSSCNCKL